MPNVYDNRRVHLSHLVERHNNRNTGRGGKIFVARAAGISHVSISNIIGRIEKSDRPGVFHLMGSDMARKIEVAFMSEKGSFDLPMGIAEVLSPSTRQIALLDAIESRIRSGVLTDEECDVELAKFESLYPISETQKRKFDDADVQSEAVFIIGTSGSGKTSLKDLVVHHIKANDGAIEIVLQ